MTETDNKHSNAAVLSDPRLNAWICLGLFLAAFLLRFTNLEITSPFSGDEAMHSVSAINYTERGYFGPDNWYHPPLKHILLYGSIKLFGDGPYGWRMRNVLFGAATVLMLFLLSQKLFASLIISTVSSVLLLLDPLHIIFSRTTFEDIPAVFFLLAGLYFSIVAARQYRERYWIFSGILFGLSLSLKWYSLNIQLIVMAAAVIQANRRGGWPATVQPIIYLTLLPCIIYLLCFFPWFLKGYSLVDWVLMQSDAFRELRDLSIAKFHPVLSALESPSQWFTRMIAVGFGQNHADTGGFSIVVMNNFPIWLCILPAVLYLLVTGVRERDRSANMIALSFWALYLPFLLVRRPIFLYTSLTLLPFGFIAIGWSAERLLKKQAWVFLVIAALWSLILYPLVVGISVPLWIYKPLLSLIKYIRPS